MRAVLVCGGLLLALEGYARLGNGYSYFGTPLPPRLAPPLSLQRDDGGMFDLATLQGRAVLVYFGYTHCPDVCPTTLAGLRPVFARLGADAAQVRVIFVTLDPGHDTPPVLRAYLHAFSPAPLGLTGSPSAIARAARAWDITWRVTGADGFLDHTSALTLVGPDGRLRARYGFSQLSDPAAMATDIRHILHAQG